MYLLKLFKCFFAEYSILYLFTYQRLFENSIFIIKIRPNFPFGMEPFILNMHFKYTETLILNLAFLAFIISVIRVFK